MRMPSAKRLQISKANATIVAVVSVAAFVTTFSLVAGQALLSKRSHQARVIFEKETARNQLLSNITASESLITAYQEFISRPENVIGGDPAGSGERDGDNARLILDALPSKYDFHSLDTSIE